MSARVAPITAMDVEAELKRKKEVNRRKKLTLKDKEFNEVFLENKRKAGLIPAKKKKVWNGKVNVDTDLVEPGKVLYSKDDFLDMYEQKYHISDTEESDTDSEDAPETQPAVAAAAEPSKKASIPSPSMAHRDLATSTNPEGQTAEEREVYALAGSLAGSKKLDEVCISV